MTEPQSSETAKADPAAEEAEVSTQTVDEPEQKAAGRVAQPIRQVLKSRLSVAVLALSVIGISVGSYLAVSSSPPGQSATGNVSRNVVGTSSKGANTAASAVPGPMPGAPTTSGTHPAHGTSASVSDHGQSADTPKALKPSNLARVSSWNKGPAGTALSLITSQAGTVMMARGTGQYPQMLQACKALSGSVQSAEALPPIPDAGMQQLYTKSLAAFDSGIAACVQGITQHSEGVEDTVTDVNQAYVKQAVNHFNVGMTDLYLATEVLRKQ